MSERVTLHVFEKDGTNHQVGECAVDDQETISAYIVENVAKFHELRIVDMMDNTLFHVVEQVLVFPIPEGGSTNNKWDPATRKFVEQTA